MVFWRPPLPSATPENTLWAFHRRSRRWQRPLHVAAACRSCSQLGVARQRAAWTCRSGWVKVVPQVFPRAEGLGTAGWGKLGGADFQQARRGNIHRRRAQCQAMTRPLRIEFPGALYHVTSRGNGSADIYLNVLNPVRAGMVETPDQWPWSICLTTTR